MAKKATTQKKQRTQLLVNTDSGIEEFFDCTVTVEDHEDQTLLIYDGESVVAEFKSWNYWRFA